MGPALFLGPGASLKSKLWQNSQTVKMKKNIAKYLPLRVDDHCRGWEVLSKLSTMSKKSMGIAWILPWTNHYDQLNCYIPFPLPLLCHLMCGGGSLGSHSHTVNGLNKPEPARGADAFCAAAQKEHFAAISFFFLLLLNLHLTEKKYFALSAKKLKYFPHSSLICIEMAHFIVKLSNLKKLLQLHQKLNFRISTSC